MTCTIVAILRTLNSKKSAITVLEYQTMEAFCDLLRVIRLNVFIYHNAMVCGNWRLNEKELGITCFHMVTLGGCKMEVPGYLNTTLNAGDLVIFPKEISHTMAPLEERLEPHVHLPYSKASARDGTGMLCGEVRFQHRASHQLLAALPSVFIIPNDDGCNWLGPIATLLREESLAGAAGANVFIDRLAEVVFMYALRHYVVTHSGQTGILSLYSHPRLSIAINLMHDEPERDWTLEALAKHSAQSRTQFAKTFREVSGLTPMEYLTWWRMQLAWGYLSEGNSVSSVAEKIGYKSESSFMRAFKKVFEVTAGHVRKNAGSSKSAQR